MDTADRHLAELSKKFESAIRRVQHLEEEKTDFEDQIASLQNQLRAQLQQHQEDLYRARLQLESQAREKEEAVSALRRANIPELAQKLAQAEADLKLFYNKHQELVSTHTKLQEESEQFKEIIRQQERELNDGKARLCHFEEYINKLDRAKKKAVEDYYLLKEHASQLAGDLVEAQQVLESKQSEEDRKTSRLRVQNNDFKSAVRQRNALETRTRELETENKKLSLETQAQKEKLQVYRQRKTQLEGKIASLEAENERLKWENDTKDSKISAFEGLSMGFKSPESLIEQKLKESEGKIVKLSEQIGPLIELNDKLTAENRDKTEEIRRLKDVNKALNQTLLTRSKELNLLESIGQDTGRKDPEEKGTASLNPESRLEFGQVYNSAGFLASRKAKFLASQFNVESPAAISNISPARLDLGKVYGNKDVYEHLISSETEP